MDPVTLRLAAEPLIMAALRGKLGDFGRSFKTRPGMMMLVAALFGGPFASTCYVVGLQMAGSIVVPISALCPAIGAILARFLFLSFLVGSTTAAPLAYYFRNLMVKERSQIQITAIIVSGIVGVTCAYRGWGSWGIAVQTVVYSGMNALLIWLRSP